MKKQWLPVKGYEELYEISNFGEVKRLERLDNRGRHLKEKLLSPGKNKWGYLYVVLSKNGFAKPFTIHRLVWQTFVGEIPEGMQCNHIDEDKENNRLKNLNLMTSKENCNWGTRNAKVAAALVNHPQKSKPVEAIDKLNGRVVFVFPSTREAGRQGFNRSHIFKCCNGERKSHKGFIWRYKD